MAEFFCVSVTLLLQEQASLKISIAYNNINLGLVELRQAQQLIEGAPDVMKDQQLWWGAGTFDFSTHCHSELTHFHVFLYLLG